MTKNNYNLAIYWLEKATKIQPKIENGGFVLLDYYTYLPYINLCVCYDKLGNSKLAYEYNEKAGKIKPTSLEYLQNKKYFENLKIN